MFDVALRAGEQIVHTQDVMPLIQKPVDQVRAKKPGTSCDEYPLLRKIITSHAIVPVSKFQSRTAVLLAGKAEQNG
jgi:hypothetical protein